jgi:site-specific recombinase
MSADEFTKLFKYMEERFDQIDKKFEASDMRFDQVMGAIDALSKRQEINDEERLVMGHQLTRLDTWVHQLANKIGVTLSA